MLEREGGDSPSPEDEIDGGLSIDEVVAQIVALFRERVPVEALNAGA